MEDSGIDTNDNNIKIYGTTNASQHGKHDATAHKSKELVNSDSETESEGSIEIEWDPREELAKTRAASSTTNNVRKPDTSNSALLGGSQGGQSALVLEQPSSGKSTGLTRDVRHKRMDVQAGVHGHLESTSLLVDVPIDGQSDTDDEIPLSWQRSSRSMREQLIKDGYNLDLESDNEDLDLIPPKQTYGGGGICSCSKDTCTIS